MLMLPRIISLKLLWIILGLTFALLFFYEKPIGKSETDRKQKSISELANDKQETVLELENDQKQQETINRLEKEKQQEKIPKLENDKKQEAITRHNDTKEEIMFKKFNINMKFYLNTSQHLDEIISLGKVNPCKNLLTDNQTVNTDTGILLKLCKGKLYQLSILF